MRTAAVVAASLLVLASCSGEDGPDAAASAAPSTADEATDEATASTESAETPDATSVDTTDADDDSASATSTTAAAATSDSSPTGTTAPRSTSTTMVVQLPSTTVAPTGASTTVASGTPTTTATSATPTTTTLTPTPTTTTTLAAPPVPDAAAALGAFQAIVAAFDADDDFDEFDECPLDPTGDLLVATFAGIADPALASAINSPADSVIFDLEGGYGPIVTCDFFSQDGPESVGLFAIAAPGDIAAYAEYVGNPDEFGGVQILVEPTITVGAGAVHHVCAFDELESEFDFCEVDWVADGVLIGAYVAGPATAGVDRAALEAGFLSQLTAIVDAFAA